MANFNHFKNVFKSIFIIFTACIGIGFLLYFYASETLLNTTAESLEEMAKLGAIIVEKEIHRRIQSLETISKTNAIRNPNLGLKDKAVYLNNYLTEDFIRITISDSQGEAWTSDGNNINIKDREHYQKAVSGIKNVSNPIVSMIRSEIIVVFAVPYYVNNEIAGALCGVYKGEELSKITDGFRLGDQGNSFIVDRFGKFVAHDDRNLVYSQYNPIQEANKEPSLKKLAGLIEKMTQGKTGAGSYHFFGTEKYLGFAPIKGTNWSLAVAAPKNQIFKSINKLLAFLVGSILIICIIIIVLNSYMEYLRKRVLKERKVSSNVIDIANMIVIKYDHQGNIFEFNKFAEIKTGFEKEEVIGKKNLSDFIVSDFKNNAATFETLSKGVYPRKIELAITAKDGGAIYFIGHRNCLDSESSNRRVYELMGIDVTEMVETEKQLLENHEQLANLNQEILTSEEELRVNYEELLKSQQLLSKSEERYSLVVDAAGIGIWDCDVQTKKVFISTECGKILGINPDSDLDFFQEVKKRIHPDEIEYVTQIWEAYLRSKSSHYQSEYRIVLPNGKIRWVQALIKCVWNKDGELIRMAGSYLDVTTLKEYQRKLHYLAYHDSLTGLPNRLMLLNYWIEISANNRKKIAIFFMDSDNFKFINDTLGHNFGDRLIKAISSRLQTISKEESVVFRIAGDEFVICASGLNSVKEIKNEADRILGSFAEPFELGTIRVHVTVSMGIAIYPDHAVEIGEMLKNADMAMYKAKELGKNRYVIYDPRLQTVVDERVKLGKHLRYALPNNEFSLYYQPQIDLKTGRVSGFEALLRWFSPELGMVPPLKFIKITEESGMIVELGEWVLERACEFIKRMERTTGTLFSISVNVSIIQLMQDNFVQRVFAILEKYQVEPERVELEITESVLIESYDAIYRQIKMLRDYRINVALDDFGKGYSSLYYLCQLPISTLKIDKTFIDNIIINTDKGRIITGDIVAIGHKVGLKVIAEGVETKEQIEHLMKHGCDKIQGYFYCKPLPEKEVIQFIEAKN
jgi:diguanylate cyclase (GGDEF)-like protein/PAS domain S-box-containing protein